MNPNEAGLWTVTGYTFQYHKIMIILNNNVWTFKPYTSKYIFLCTVSKYVAIKYVNIKVM